MKLFLRNISIYFVFLIVVYPILIAFVGYFIPQLFKPNINYFKGSYGQLHLRLKQLKTSVRNVDVVFLGSSHSYRGFDTRNFENIKSFNLGSSAQTPINTKVLLERYLDKIDPKVAIYEVYPENFSSDGVESSLDIIANDRNDDYSISMALKANNIKVYNTLVYGFISDWLKLNDDFEENEKKGKDKYVSGGFVEREMECYMAKGDRGLRKWEVKSKQIKAFEECIELMKKKGVALVLVFAPITQNLYNSYGNNNFIDSLMKSYGLEYYNFNELMQLNDSLDFYDAHHLNQNGVNKFNSKLKEVLPKYFKVAKDEN